MTASAALCGAVAVALHAGHRVGDFWVQTDAQARSKGLPGADGVLACLAHVLSYLAAQVVCLSLAAVVLALPIDPIKIIIALLVSGGTHYVADRREHGLMFWLARRLPGKAPFLTVGVPRQDHDDNPCLGTGAGALDQSWHVFFGVFIPALIIAS